MAVNKANIISKIHQLTLIIFQQHIMLQVIFMCTVKYFYFIVFTGCFTLFDHLNLACNWPRSQWFVINAFIILV